MIWTKLDDCSDEESPPWFEEIDNSFEMAESVHEWPTHISRCVENQLDYAHLPFVHSNTIGKNFEFSETREVTESDGKISIFLEKNRGASIHI